MAKKKATRKRKLPHWLNKKEMAASIGISVQAFGNWKIDPVAKIGRETFYTVDDVLDFYVERELKRFGENDNQPIADIEEQLSSGDLSASKRGELLRIRKLELENHRLKLQNEVLEGRSLPSWAVTQVLAKILSRTGEIFDGLPLKVKRKFPRIDKRIVELIKSEIIKSQNEVHRLGEYTEEIIDDVVAQAEERIR